MKNHFRNPFDYPPRNQELSDPPNDPPAHRKPKKRTSMVAPRFRPGLDPKQGTLVRKVFGKLIKLGITDKAFLHKASKFGFRLLTSALINTSPFLPPSSPRKSPIRSSSASGSIPSSSFLTTSSMGSSIRSPSFHTSFSSTAPSAWDPGFPHPCHSWLPPVPSLPLQPDSGPFPQRDRQDRHQSPSDRGIRVTPGNGKPGKQFFHRVLFAIRTKGRLFGIGRGTGKEGIDLSRTRGIKLIDWHRKNLLQE